MHVNQLIYGSDRSVEAALQRLLLSVLTGLMLNTTACSPAGPVQEKLVLESGKTVSILEKKGWTFEDGSPPALQLRYQTLLPIEDSVSLKLEAAEVWRAFAPEVEERGFSAAILTATHIMGRSADTTYLATYGFIAQKDSTGIWHLD